jgi:hypothetical protein
MHLIKKYQLIIFGLILGGIGGFLYYQYIGCMSGTCSITSSPINSTAYGAAMGAVFLNIFQK